MKLTEINIYPIKSFRGISLKQSRIEEKGLEFDRRWMIVDEKNGFLTQREFPKMAVLEVEIKKSLIVRDGNNEIKIPFLPQTDKTANVKIWSGSCRAKVYEGEINDWLSDVLETDCKLVLMPAETKRAVNPFYAVNKFKDTVSFADGYPFLLIGESSLNDLNSRLEKKIPMNRFRPNFVFDDSEPFAEDNWKKIKIGKTVFHLVKPCARCVMTTIDQKTGIFDGKEPLKTLASYRLVKKGGEQKILFGQNLIAENAGEVLRIGDKIEVIETKN
jgi:uncharacterized protein